MIRLGRATQAAHGLADLMGYDSISIVQHIMTTGGGIAAIKNEVMLNGNAEDKTNMKGLIDGTYVNPDNDDETSAEELAAQKKTIDKRTTDTESKWTTKTVKSTWSYNMSSGTWTALADAPFEHDFFFVLEQPGRERIVSVDEANLASHDMLGSIAYNIASNVWEHNTSVPPKPHKHDQSQSLASMMVP